MSCQLTKLKFLNRARGPFVVAGANPPTNFILADGQSAPINRHRLRLLFDYAIKEMQRLPPGKVPSLIPSREASHYHWDRFGIAFEISNEGNADTFTRDEAIKITEALQEWRHNQPCSKPLKRLGDVKIGTVRLQYVGQKDYFGGIRIEKGRSVATEEDLADDENECKESPEVTSF